MCLCTSPCSLSAKFVILIFVIFLENISHTIWNIDSNNLICFEPTERILYPFEAGNLFLSSSIWFLWVGQILPEWWICCIMILSFPFSYSHVSPFKIKLWCSYDFVGSSTGPVEYFVYYAYFTIWLSHRVSA